MDRDQKMFEKHYTIIKAYLELSRLYVTTLLLRQNDKHTKLKAEKCYIGLEFQMIWAMVGCLQDRKVMAEGLDS